MVIEVKEHAVSKVPSIRFKGFIGEWNNTTLMSACSLLTGHPFQSKGFSNSGVFLVRGMNVKRGFIDSSDQISEYWQSSSGLEVFLLQMDDIVIQMDGALIGSSYGKIKEEHLPALLVQRVTRARCESTSNSDYIYQYIERDFLKYIRANKTETAVPHLSLNDIRQFPISISSQCEQTKIGGYFRALDLKIALRQQKHDKLVTLKKAMLQKMFPQRGATTPEVRFKGFSGEWMEKKLGEISFLLTGYPFEGKKFVDKGVLLVRGMNVKRGYLDTSKGTSEYWPSVDGFETFLLQADDIVIQMDGALIGRSYAKIREVHLPALLVQRVTRVRCQASNCDFVYQWIQEKFLRYIRSTRTETAVPHLSLDDIRSFPVALPCEAEQQKIGCYFRTLDTLISKYAIHLQKLKQIKSACLEKMFV